MRKGRGDVNQKYMKMTKDAILEGSSQQANKEAINRRNDQGPQHLKFFLLVFLIWTPKPKLRPKPTHDFIIPHALEENKSKGTSIDK